MTPRTPSRQDRFITDDELQERLADLPGGAEIVIDDLDRHVTTQKPEGRDARDRAAVEAHLKARGVTFNLEQR